MGSKDVTTRSPLAVVATPEVEVHGTLLPLPRRRRDAAPPRGGTRDRDRRTTRLGCRHLSRESDSRGRVVLRGISDTFATVQHVDVLLENVVSRRVEMGSRCGRGESRDFRLHMLDEEGLDRSRSRESGSFS